MSDTLYKKLCDVNLLKQAWHLARLDCKRSFIQDPFHYNDFAFTLDNRLSLLRENLMSGDYHPHSLLRIDIPKDLLAVRPGSLIDINDLIVLYAIIMLIAPRLDKKLPKSVYSYRYRPDRKRKILFKEDKILEYTFLKKKTISKRIEIFNPWYEQWPTFIKKSVYAFEEEGFRYLSVSDIASYFENINLDILRDLLLKYFPHDQKLINLLINILEHWTWPTKHFKTIKRGIPQGNNISSFLGNIYLLPLDQAFKEFSIF
jgi:retron-type reverse transcriptase